MQTLKQDEKCVGDDFDPENVLLPKHEVEGGCDGRQDQSGGHEAVPRARQQQTGQVQQQEDNEEAALEPIHATGVRQEAACQAVAAVTAVATKGSLSCLFLPFHA